MPRYATAVRVTGVTGADFTKAGGAVDSRRGQHPTQCPRRGLRLLPRPPLGAAPAQRARAIRATPRRDPGRATRPACQPCPRAPQRSPARDHRAAAIGADRAGRSRQPLPAPESRSRFRTALAGCGKSPDFGKTAVDRLKFWNSGHVRSMGYRHTVADKPGETRIGRLFPQPARAGSSPARTTSVTPTVERIGRQRIDA
jgi:hypothetical protein